MFHELIGIGYLGAIAAACFVGASAKPRYRGPLITLGAVLLVLPVLFVACIVFALIALSHDAHFG